MTAKCPRRRELAQLVSDHLLADEDRHVLATVVDGDRVPDHVREHGRRARPRLERTLLPGGVHLLDAAHQPFLDERPLLGRTAHLLPPLLAAAAAANDQLVGFLVLATRALAERRHAPRRHRVVALGLALATAMRMVDRVHGGT